MGLLAEIAKFLGFGPPPRRKARKPRSATWGETERTACKRRGQTHLGGPSNWDCVGPGKGTEVKDWSRPVHAGVVVKAAKKARREGVRPEVVAPAGFTEPAQKVARKRRVKLSSR